MVHGIWCRRVKMAVWRIRSLESKMVLCKLQSERIQVQSKVESLGTRCIITGDSVLEGWSDWRSVFQCNGEDWSASKKGTFSSSLSFYFSQATRLLGGASPIWGEFLHLVFWVTGQSSIDIPIISLFC